MNNVEVLNPLGGFVCVYFFFCSLNLFPLGGLIAEVKEVALKFEKQPQVMIEVAKNALVSVHQCLPRCDRAGIQVKPIPQRYSLTHSLTSCAVTSGTVCVSHSLHVLLLLLLLP